MIRLLSKYYSAAKPKGMEIAFSKAINSPSPQKLHTTHTDAKLLIFLRWLLPDWAWEQLIRRAIQ